MSSECDHLLLSCCTGKPIQHDSTAVHKIELPAVLQAQTPVPVASAHADAAITEAAVLSTSEKSRIEQQQLGVHLQCCFAGWGRCAPWSPFCSCSSSLRLHHCQHLHLSCRDCCCLSWAACQKLQHQSHGAPEPSSCERVTPQDRQLG